MSDDSRLRIAIFLFSLAACGGGKGSGTDSATTGTSGSSGDATATDGASSTDGPEPGDMSATSTLTGVPTVTGDPTATSMMTGAPTVTGDTDSSASATSAMTAPTSDAIETMTSGEPVEPCEGEPVPIDAEILSYLESQTGQLPDDDPTRMYIRFSDLAFTCDDPHDPLPCGQHWELSLRIPTAFQAPGLYSLWLGDVHGFGLSNGVDLGGDECDGGGGMVKGTLEIVSIDEQAVTGRLCHVTWTGLDDVFDLDGSFVAPRCPR